MPYIIGVQFRHSSKTYHFVAPEEDLCPGTYVIAETSRGLEYGKVSMGRRFIAEEDVHTPLKDIIRAATDQDRLTHENNLRKAEEAQAICLEKVSHHGLEMKVTGVEYTFDNSKIIFYFTADGRVDFRALVKDLAAIFHTRIELRQIGVRDEAKQIGGIGICGYPLCCKRYMGDFSPVSIKMAKNQKLSLNPSNISGSCGRLLCCLNYENDLYVERQREEAKARRKASQETQAQEIAKPEPDTTDEKETQIIIEEIGQPPAPTPTPTTRQPSSPKHHRKPQRGDSTSRGKRRQSKRPPRPHKDRHEA